MSEHDRRNIYERRRNIVYLISEYLKNSGLTKSHSTLIDEAQLSGDFIVCDNVDLDTLYLEYSSFYEVKFGKKPRFVKRVDQIQNPLKSQVSNSSLTTSESKISLSKRRASMKTEQHPPVKNVDSTDYIRVSSLTTSSSTPIENNGNLSPIPLKPLSFLSSNTISDDEFFLCHPSDWKAMTEMIYKDIVRRDLCVKWDQIVGLDDAKQILQESVILPLKYPQIFRQVQTWKAVLLHGVPGCGKTLLAKALCSEIHDGNFTFFNISASTLISKWRGESEKLMRVLFEVAKFHSPSIIFIDELDSLTSKRNAREHEASKRLKNEFLSLLDGLETTDGGDERRKVFILGSTNMPWEIDQAFLRRFEKKILVDIPTFAERLSLIKHYLPSSQYWKENDLEELAECSKNFTGDDIRVAVKEAKMMIVRKAIQNKEEKLVAVDVDVESHHLKDSLKQIKPNPENDIFKQRQWSSSSGKF